jgi:hypothetical protein
MAAGTGQLSLVRAGRIELQQLGQGGRPSFVHGGTNRHLDRFQVQPTCLLPLPEDTLEQLLYFSADFLLKCFRRFFFEGGSSLSAAGRARQIFSLRVINSWDSSRNC